MNFREFFESAIFLTYSLDYPTPMNKFVQNPAGLVLGDSVVLSNSEDALVHSNYKGIGSGHESGKLVNFRLSTEDDSVGIGHLMGYVKFSKISYWVPVSSMRTGEGGLEARIKFSGVSGVYDSRGSSRDIWVSVGVLKKLVVGREGELYHTSR